MMVADSVGRGYPPEQDIQWSIIPRRWVSAPPAPPEPDMADELFAAAEVDGASQQAQPRRGLWARLTGAVGTVAAGVIAVLFALVAPAGIIGLIIWTVAKNVGVLSGLGV